MMRLKLSGCGALISSSSTAMPMFVSSLPISATEITGATNATDAFLNGVVADADEADAAAADIPKQRLWSSIDDRDTQRGEQSEIRARDAKLNRSSAHTSHSRTGVSSPVHQRIGARTGPAAS